MDSIEALAEALHTFAHHREESLRTCPHKDNFYPKASILLRLLEDFGWRLEKIKCSFDPSNLIDVPLGMFHCPECNEMIIAGFPHDS